MDSVGEFVIPITKAVHVSPDRIGGKAAQLAKLRSMGYRVPDGFCITIDAYYRFIEVYRLDRMIGVELGRKAFAEMRWEELWDAALRIRSNFLRSEIPEDVGHSILKALQHFDAEALFAIRSTAPKEDTSRVSFAGLHDSVVGVAGVDSVLDAVRRVWASLWSDAALLYQQELGLDPARSAMAVLVQTVVEEKPSGVAFGRDPRSPDLDRAVVEAVPGRCQDLVDGSVDPDRWVLQRPEGNLDVWTQGNRVDSSMREPLLEEDDVLRVFRTLTDIEERLGWPPDIEWTGTHDRFTLLQARPITTTGLRDSDEKSYYLTLRPRAGRLRSLARRVSEELIPELEAEGLRMAGEDLNVLDDPSLAEAVGERQNLWKKWKGIYLEDFIPFAHGVRALARYYNDAVHPEDPYEFLGLLLGQSMIAVRRNRAFEALADLLRNRPDLTAAVGMTVTGSASAATVESLAERLEEIEGGDSFLEALETLEEDFLDVAYGSQRLRDRLDVILPAILEIVRREPEKMKGAAAVDAEILEERLISAVGTGRRAEAEDAIRIGRLSWKLRDDDNLLLGRMESQFLRSVNLGVRRLQEEGRLDPHITVDGSATDEIVRALKDPSYRPTVHPASVAVKNAGEEDSRVRPRQLTGQPTAPGMASGRVRCIRFPDDLGRFRAGEILVCDAIQPHMTHLALLAGGIVERRGGMLIHGAIIAREMGIPCVNGVPRAAEILEDGDLVTVDGGLGIVTVGEPDFDLELSPMKKGKDD